MPSQRKRLKPPFVRKYVGDDPKESHALPDPIDAWANAVFEAGNDSCADNAALLVLVYCVDTGHEDGADVRLMEEGLTPDQLDAIAGLCRRAAKSKRLAFTGVRH